jgi:uncharacterized membrane protein
MRILYLEGDPCAPRFVAAGLRAAGRVVSRPERLEQLVSPFDVCVLSDIPADQLGHQKGEAIAAAVATGSGLWVVGGWYSLGYGGHAHGPLEAVLPVEMIAPDDRVHRPSGLFLTAASRHPVLDGLPLDEPPVLTGYNRVRPRADAEVVLEGRWVEGVSHTVATLSNETVPLLVLGTYGTGRVAVLATDLAPRWSGGWTDWGAPRQRVEQGEELGAGYVRFLRQVTEWLAGGRAVQAGAAGAPGRPEKAPT